MRIAHIEIAGAFTEGMTYQNNLLTEQNIADGHQVLFIANAQKYENGKLVPTEPTDIILSNGMRLVRIPYERILTNSISEKFRKVKNLYKLLDNFSPDVIMVHCLSFWSILDIVRYKKDHPKVKFYADTHTAAHNSGSNWLSLHVLHRVFYRALVQRAIPYLDKYFYIAKPEKDFSVQNYGVPESLMEFYPLGGTVFSDTAYAEKRDRRRKELELGLNELLFVHTGKLEALKRSEELLRAFAAVPKLNAKLVIIGYIPDDMTSRLMPLIEADDRVKYLGWRSASELLEYLCACDLYLQPGEGSATMQNAVCAGCPVLAYPHDYYTQGFDYNNIIWVRTEAEIVSAFQAIMNGTLSLNILRKNSEKCARELLDYRKLAARLYQ